MQTTRRQWLTTGMQAAGLALGCGFLPAVGSPSSQTGAEAAEPESKAERQSLVIGCFNRPWSAGSYDDALAGMQTAGFRVTGLLGDHKGELFTSPDATPAYLDRLAERITSRGLSLVVGWLRTRHDIPYEESFTQARKQIDHAQRLGVKFMLTVGVDPPAQFEHYYRVLAATAAYAAERRIQIVLKPHGGCSLAADEILRCVERVGHANFRVWFDAGNIVHYSDKDPVIEAGRLAKLVTGFCAKDCAGPKGDVMLAFGSGKVQFAGVLAQLREAGFAGPVMVECCAGKTLDEITAGASANREYLEKLIRGT